MAQSVSDTERDPETVAVEQYAGDTIQLETHIVGVMNSPTIIEGTVSNTGKTISAPHPHDDGKTFRLDTAEILSGESEYRDSRAFSLYTREGFQRTQKANLAPGPQAGANRVSDDADLPDPTHEIVGNEGEQESDDDRDDDTPAGRDEYGRIQEGERVHVSGESDDGDVLDDRGTVENVTGTKTIVELDDGRRVTKRGSTLVEYTTDGMVIYRSPTFEHTPDDGNVKADGDRSDDQEDHMAQHDREIRADGGQTARDVLRDASEGDTLAVTLSDGRELTVEVEDVETTDDPGESREYGLTVTTGGGEFVWGITVSLDNEHAAPTVSRTVFADIAVDLGRIEESDVDDPDEYVMLDEGEVVAAEPVSDGKDREVRTDGGTRSENETLDSGTGRMSNEEYEVTYDPMFDLVDRWRITMEEAEEFLENAGYFETEQYLGEAEYFQRSADADTEQERGAE